MNPPSTANEAQQIVDDTGRCAFDTAMANEVPYDTAYKIEYAVRGELVRFLGLAVGTP